MNKKKVIFQDIATCDSSHWRETEYWKNHGSPHVLVLEYSGIIGDSKVNIYADVAYGYIFAKIGRNWTFTASGILYLEKIKTIVLTSSYYGNDIAFKPFVLTN